MADGHRTITVTELDAMTPQQRADVVNASTAQSWDDVPEPFRSAILAEARELAARRRARG
jgi:hypothetical protein